MMSPAVVAAQSSAAAGEQLYVIQASPIAAHEDLNMPEVTAASVPMTSSSDGSSSASAVPTAAATRVCDPYQVLDLPFASSNISGRERAVRTPSIFPLETSPATDNLGFIRSIFGATNRIIPQLDAMIESDLLNSVIEELSERYLFLIGVFKLSKVVRMLVFCHMAFLVIFILFSPIYVLFTPFLVIGNLPYALYTHIQALTGDT